MCNFHVYLGQHFALLKYKYACQLPEFGFTIVFFEQHIHTQKGRQTPLTRHQRSTMPRTAKLAPVSQTHPHIASQIASPLLKRTMTAGVDRCITFVCVDCQRLFRKRVDNVVRSGRARCRTCSPCPDSTNEKKLMQALEAVLCSLRAQGNVCSYTISRNAIISKAELASVPLKPTLTVRPLRWDITIVAKLRYDTDCGSIHTQKIHLELDGPQHFRFSQLWHKKSHAVYERSKEQDGIKNAIVEASRVSSYGRRFRRVSLLRMAVSGKLSALDLARACDFVESELCHNAIVACGSNNVNFYPPSMYN